MRLVKHYFIQITGTVVQMSNPKPNADSYVEIGFTNSAGVLNPGEYVEIISRIGNSYALSLATPPYSEWNYMYDQIPTTPSTTVLQIL